MWKFYMQATRSDPKSDKGWPEGDQSPCNLWMAPNLNFCSVCRANHACVPNCNYMFNWETNEQELYVVRPIRPGEELTVSTTKLIISLPGYFCLLWMHGFLINTLYVVTRLVTSQTTYSAEEKVAGRCFWQFTSSSACATSVILGWRIIKMRWTGGQLWRL